MPPSITNRKFETTGNRFLEMGTAKVQKVLDNVNLSSLLSKLQETGERPINGFRKWEHNILVKFYQQFIKAIIPFRHENNKSTKHNL